jgi:hypothetical protein
MSCSFRLWLPLWASALLQPTRIRQTSVYGGSERFILRRRETSRRNRPIPVVLLSTLGVLAAKKKSHWTVRGRCDRERERLDVQHDQLNPWRQGEGCAPATLQRGWRVVGLFLFPGQPVSPQADSRSFQASRARGTPALPRQPLCRGEAASTLGTTIGIRWPLIVVMQYQE